MIQVEHIDSNNIMVRVEFTNLCEFKAFIEKLIELNLTLDTFKGVAYAKLSENKNTRK